MISSDEICRRIQGNHRVFNTQRTVSVESLANENEDVGSGVSKISQLNWRGITAVLCGSVYC